jgi:(+)-trans-carveol dehydrogenase
MPGSSTSRREFRCRASLASPNWKEPEMGRLDGKIALITGAARGQGRSHAVHLAREGADIVAIDICAQVETVPYPMSTPEDLAQTVSEVEALDRRCLPIEADARDPRQMEEMTATAVAEHGRIDILVVNHGIVSQGGWDLMSADDWRVMIDINLNSIWFATRPVIPQMIEQGGGAIVMTSSTAGLRAVHTIINYNAAKFGVIGMMKTLAADLGQHSIRVNAVCPTNVDTPMLMNEQMLTKWTGKPNATKDDFRFPASAMNLMPVPWVEPEDISKAVLFLVSPEARYVTGVAFPVDAGLLVQPPGMPPQAIERIAELEAKGP